MSISVPRLSCPPTPQSPQSRDYSRTNNQNNHGVVGNGSNNFVNTGNINQFTITQITSAEGEDVELDRLLDGYLSKDALHNSSHSPPECHPDTRKTIRKVIGEWIDDSSSTKSPLLWLNGPAGVGKSVIAKTIAGSHDQVVGTFLFSTSSDRSAATLFPTLAWQLAQRIPETKQHIIASLKNNGSLLTSEIKEQFDHLIAQPLKKCSMTSTSLPVMVIDGIDECTDEHMLSQFLQVLMHAGKSGDVPLRFIISSRPEPRIRATLKRIQNNSEEIERQSSVPHSPQRRSLYRRPQIWIRLRLSDIRTRLCTPIIWGFRNPTLLLQEVWNLYRVVQPASVGGPSPEIRDDLFDRISHHPVISDIQIGFTEECREDIARYLTDHFAAIGRQLEEDTKSRFQVQQSDISHLVERSCGQFLYASTIVRLLEHSHPKDVLEMACRSCLPTPDLNKLYKIILKQAKDAIRNQAQEGGPDYETESGILVDTLAILIVFAENIHFANVRENFAVIESLIGIKEDRLTTKLSKMHSVLNINCGVSISVYHRSFLEFLQSRKRSGEHYVAYPNALRRFLVLLSRVGLRYSVMDWCGQLLDNDRKMREHVGNTALACRRDFFKRSTCPITLIALHNSIHFSLPFLLLVPFCQFIRQVKESLIGSPISSSAFSFILEYLFLTLLCLLILSFGSFIISLTIYTLFFNYFIILPFFHPFLHPHFTTMVEIFLPSRQDDLSTTSTHGTHQQQHHQHTPNTTSNIRSPKIIKDSSSQVGLTNNGNYSSGSGKENHAVPVHVMVNGLNGSTSTSSSSTAGAGAGMGGVSNTGGSGGGPSPSKRHEGEEAGVEDGGGGGGPGATGGAGGGGQTCLGCSATSTPQWRRGPLGPRTLCNACGLVYGKLKKKNKPGGEGGDQNARPGGKRGKGAYHKTHGTGAAGGSGGSGRSLGGGGAGGRGRNGHDHDSVDGDSGDDDGYMS